MKNYEFLLLALIIFTSCDKDENENNGDCTKSEQAYNDGKGAVLNLDTQQWHLEENGLGGVDVRVVISGSIVGDSIFIRTHGDGLIGDAKIELTSGKRFQQDVGIFFTSAPLTQENITANTSIMVFKGNDTLKVDINSSQIPNPQFVVE